MPKAIDVAAFILREKGPMSAMRLQKLCYYAQAWSLVWDDKVLFPDEIQAWANGPVIRNLYTKHAGEFMVEEIEGGDPDALDAEQEETVRMVLDHYWKFTPYQLSELTHREDPWRGARGDLPAGAKSSCEIRPSAMQEYYGGL
jgi:uncharacterized phage-associated protein